MPLPARALGQPGGCSRERSWLRQSSLEAQRFPFFPSCFSTCSLGSVSPQLLMGLRWMSPCSQ